MRHAAMPQNVEGVAGLPIVFTSLVMDEIRNSLSCPHTAPGTHPLTPSR